MLETQLGFKHRLIIGETQNFPGLFFTTELHNIFGPTCLSQMMSQRGTLHKSVNQVASLSIEGN